MEDISLCVFLVKINVKYRVIKYIILHINELHFWEYWLILLWVYKLYSAVFHTYYELLKFIPILNSLHIM